MAARRYELTDAQWERIKDMIPRAMTGRPPKDDRMMLNAMFWLARSGAAWADIPARYGPHQTVYSRFCKWRDNGTLLRIFQELNADADYENLCIDSTSIKAHPQSAGAKKGLLIRKTTSLSEPAGVVRPQKFTQLSMVWVIRYISCSPAVRCMTQVRPLICSRSLRSKGATFWATKPMVLRKSGTISPDRRPATPSHPGRTAPIRGPVISTPTRSGIWSSAFSISSRSSAGSLLAMTSWPCPFWLSYTWLLFGFC